MDARPRTRRWVRQAADLGLPTLLIAILSVSIFAGAAHAARIRTTNFVVQARTQALAEEIGRSAEQWRKELAVEWLGREMPAWSKPCPIHARVSPHLGAGGETSFVFDQGEVFGWTMKIQGSRERVLDSVLPHEITHTIFASHFRRPLPRWADEGACTTVEHPVEIGKQERMLIRFLKSGRGIAFSQMFAMKEYPRDVLPLYSQGHSLTTFLIERRGKQQFLQFLADGMADENWPRAVEKFYGHQNLFDLQSKWLAWVERGRPRLALEPDVLVASATQPAPAALPPVTPTSPSSQPAVALATPRSGGGGSVYAALASSPAPPAPAGPASNSVYDASRSGRTLMRRPRIDSPSEGGDTVDKHDAD